MINLHCNISCFNTPRKNISSCLASPIKTKSKSSPNLTPLTLVTAKKLQESKLILLKFNYSKTRRTSQRYPCKKNLPSISENDYSQIYCSQCNQWWHSPCTRIIPKDLVKYSKYHILYPFFILVFKEVSSNKNTYISNSKPLSLPVILI